MAELADAPDLGSGAPRRAGSSPVIRTENAESGLFSRFQRLFLFAETTDRSIYTSYLLFTFSLYKDKILLKDNSDAST